MSTRQQAKEALAAQHQFPGPYLVRAIGANTPEFVAQVAQAVVLVLGRQATPEITTRQSEHGRHQAVHITAHVQTADQALEIYDALRSVQGLRFLL